MRVAKVVAFILMIKYLQKQLSRRSVRFTKENVPWKLLERGMCLSH